MRWSIAFHFGVFAVELFPGAGLQFGDDVLEADGKVLAGEGAFRERSVSEPFQSGVYSGHHTPKNTRKSGSIQTGVSVFQSATSTTDASRAG